MTTFNQTTFEDNVRAYVAQGSGLAPKWVIPAEEMGPVPDEPFASVRIINDVQVGYAMDIETESVDGSVILYQRIYKSAVFSVQFYRKGAKVRAHRFAAWIQSPFSQEYEGLYCFSPQPPFDIRNLSEIITDDWEERAGLDLSLDYTADYRYDTGRIETADDLTTDRE